MKVVVVIPVYRKPNTDEIISLKRCCQVLFRHSMCLVCPQGLDISMYTALWKQYNLSIKAERFAQKYFKNIAGYNRLLLSKEFYTRFEDYDFMLIYQPDAYVFEDRLEEWCAKGYDYVGAPLVGDYKQSVYNSNMPLVVGNGGFSLRKIHTYIKTLSSYKHVFSSNQIAVYIGLREKPFTRWIVWALMLLGWRNTPASIAKSYKWNEDLFWSCFFEGTQYHITKPNPHEALFFAFERFPSAMYEMTRNNLPMGCHAWRKYEYDTFWKNTILS